MCERKIKTIVVGLGFIGAVHAKNILANDDFELTGIVDPRSRDCIDSLGKSGNFGELNLPMDQLKRVPYFPSLDQALNEAEFEVAVVATPLFLHYELTEKLLRKRIHTMVEKPFCPTVAECLALDKLAKEQNVCLMVAHCLRFAGAYTGLRQWISDGRAGKLKYLELSRSGGAPQWGIWQDEKIRANSGGALYDMLIHDLDIVQWVLGCPPVLSVDFKRNHFWDISLQYPEHPVRLVGGFLTPHMAFTAGFTACFEHGSLKYHSADGDSLHWATDQDAGSIAVDGDPYAAELAYFGTCVRENHSPEECLPQSAAAAIGLCEKIQGMEYKKCGVEYAE